MKPANTNHSLFQFFLPSKRIFHIRLPLASIGQAAKLSIETWSEDTKKWLRIGAILKYNHLIINFTFLINPHFQHVKRADIGIIFSFH
jgi:hypothetical protein